MDGREFEGCLPGHGWGVFAYNRRCFTCGTGRMQNDANLPGDTYKIRQIKGGVKKWCGTSMKRCERWKRE